MLHDIMFLVNILKNPPHNFCVSEYVTFVGHTRASSSSSTKLHPNFNYSLILLISATINQVVRVWNSLHPIDLSLSKQTVKQRLIGYLWQHFLGHFDLNITFMFLLKMSLIKPYPCLILNIQLFAYNLVTYLSPLNYYYYYFFPQLLRS